MFEGLDILTSSLLPFLVGAVTRDDLAAISLAVDATQAPICQTGQRRGIAVMPPRFSNTAQKRPRRAAILRDVYVNPAVGIASHIATAQR